jgi:DNA repair protein RadC
MKKYLQNVTNCPMMAEVKLAYKPTINPNNQPKVTSSTDAYNYLMSIWDNDTIEYTETMCVLMLNRKNRIIGWSKISSGATAGVLCDPKVIFQLALLNNASSIILAHNHPSGDTKPSYEDIALTKRVIALGLQLDLACHDHLIITSYGYLSLQEEGLV